MGKRKKRKYRTEVILSGSEKYLVKLEQVSRARKCETCRSLITWFLSNQSWTPKQWALVKKITKDEIINKTPEAKYHLYAITDGVNVKIGFSSNVGRRVKSIQTGNAANISIIWRYFVGYKLHIAKREEKRLHKLCKKHHIRGEWYESGCMPLVEAYSVKYG